MLNKSEVVPTCPCLAHSFFKLPSPAVGFLEQDLITVECSSIQACFNELYIDVEKVPYYTALYLRASSSCPHTGPDSTNQIPTQDKNLGGNATFARARPTLPLLPADSASPSVDMV